MLVATLAPQATEIKKIHISPRILPIKLGIARIIDRSHIFLHEIDMTNLEYDIKTLQIPTKTLNPRFPTRNLYY